MYARSADPTSNMPHMAVSACSWRRLHLLHRPRGGTGRHGGLKIRSKIVVGAGSSPVEGTISPFTGEG